MSQLQFRVLYRQFLFRVVDLELLSPHAQGGAGKLLGQFAALLVLMGLWLSLGASIMADGRKTRSALLIGAWGIEHTLIATTMLVVGIFAVLSWDSAFPDRRDILVLAPLPVPAATLFLAKAAASASALGLTVFAFNAFPSVTLSFALASPEGGVLDLLLSPDLYRSFTAYWITMLSAGGFLFGGVLCLQGLAAQLLPRRHYLRASALLQMAAFCLVVTVYFLQPPLASPPALTAPSNQRLLAWLPSYWFLGLFQQLNGSMHPAVAPVARRAWMGLAAVACGTPLACLLCFFRARFPIAEEPDILPAVRGGWLPCFGNAFQTAIAQFSVRTLLRSRQHRTILAFYLGIGFAITVLYLKANDARGQVPADLVPDPWRSGGVALLASSIVLLSAWVVGTRVVFALPLDLRANWIFQVAPLRGGTECLAARRRALLALSVVPAWAGCAVLFFSAWPWKPAAGHLLILALLGIVLAELCLHGAQKIPFTCSYLPGRSDVHLTFWICTGLIMTLVKEAAEYEHRVLSSPARYAQVLLLLAAAGVVARRYTAARALSDHADPQFEQAEPPVILSLGLHGGGAAE